MSRVRTGLSPDDWRDDGPGAARTHTAIWGTHNASVVGSMTPMVRLPNALTNAESRHAHKTKATRDARRNVAPGRAHQGKVYATDEERHAARQATWRASKERARMAGA